MGTHGVIWRNGEKMAHYDDLVKNWTKWSIKKHLKIFDWRWSEFRIFDWLKIYLENIRSIEDCLLNIYLENNRSIDDLFFHIFNRSMICLFRYSIDRILPSESMIFLKNGKTWVMIPKKQSKTEILTCLLYCMLMFIIFATFCSIMLLVLGVCGRNCPEIIY